MPSPSLSIAFVTVADLPEGGGRTGRLRTLAGALVGMGHRVVIWNEHGMNLAGVQHVSGELGGTHFEYVLGTTQRAHGFRAVGLKLRAVRRILDRMRAAARRAGAAAAAAPRRPPRGAAAGRPPRAGRGGCPPPPPKTPAPPPGGGPL